jgi:WD40 repeat protein
MLGMQEGGSGRLLATLQGHTGAVWSVALAADGQLLASGGGDGTARLWSLADLRPGERSMLGMQEASTGRLLTTVQSRSGAVWSVALAADGRLMASGSGDGRVWLWEPSTGQPIATLQGHTGGVWGLALSADGHLLASGSEDGTVRLWSLADLRLGERSMLGMQDASSVTCLQVMRSARRYERVDITGLTGMTAAQRAALLALGAVEQHRAAHSTAALA